VPTRRGARYFQDLSERNPADATALALAGFFQVRAGQNVTSAIGNLDKAATMDAGLPQYLRGLALAGLLAGAELSAAEPAAARTSRADQVVADLELVLAARDQFPVALLRAAHQGLARAYRALGRQEQAAEALRQSGLGPAAADLPPMFTSFSVTARDGMRLSAPRVLSPVPEVQVALSYDFGDFAFIQTSAGVVAIDAGTSPDRVRAAMADLGLQDHGPVSHLILTHAHFDHIGGSEAVRGPGTEVIASAGFPAEAERQRHLSLPFRYLVGTGASPASDVRPDRLITERTSLFVGDTEFFLIPVRGGEIPGALMVYLPASGLLFAGDVMMPYVGVPFDADGSPEGLLDTIRYIRELAPRQLIAGHTTLTENFTIEALAGLEPALTELREFALARISENVTLSAILDAGYLPPCSGITPRRSCPTWSAVIASSPGSTTSAPGTGGQTDRGSKRGARRKRQQPWTCWPDGRRTLSSPPLPLWPTRETWPLRSKSSLRACSGIPTAASSLSSGRRSWPG
jgi:glyoxylase-like metal-dependent hydrolase (beta-lactamase superfamily II)